MTFNNHWYVLRVRPQHELKLASSLEKSGFKVYVPYVFQFRKWSDRIKKIKKPLIPRLVFIQICVDDQKKVFDFSAVLGYLNFNGLRAKVWPDEIKRLKKYCEQEYSTKQLKPGALFKTPVLGTDAELLSIDRKNFCRAVSQCGRYIIKFKLAS